MKHAGFGNQSKTTLKGGQEFSVLVFVWHLEVTNWFHVFDQCLEPSVQHELKRGQHVICDLFVVKKESFRRCFDLKPAPNLGAKPKPCMFCVVLCFLNLSRFVLERRETLFGV